MTQIHPLKIGVEEYKEPEIICNFKELAEDEWSKDELLDIIGKMYDHCKTMKQDIAETKFYGGLISISLLVGVITLLLTKLKANTSFLFKGIYLETAL